MQIVDILKAAQQQNSSDIHIVPGNPVMLRIDGKLVPQGNQVLTNVETDNLLSPIVPQELKDVLKEKGELDFAFSVEGFSRVRANVFRQRGSYAAALRILSYDVPTPQQLGIPQSVVNLTTKMRGLVLVTGATGSGKSTTLASLIDVIASRDSKNIITLEDPIEYLHSRRRSIVEQREIGKDTLSYAAALRAALRQDPDVILVGEMRDLETISTAITAAETGHLVFSTLHTNSSSDAIDRMIDVFPPHQQQQIRVQLSGVLEGIVAQHLLPMVNGGRIEALNGILYIVVFAVNGLELTSIIYCFLTSALIVLSVIDWRTYEIPFGINIFILVLGILHVFLDHDNWSEYVIGFFCVSLFLELLLLVSGGRAIGGGDVKLMACAGLAIGWQNITLAFFLGCIIGSVIHLIRMKVTNAGNRLAMGPYLAAGIFISMLWGEKMITAYLTLAGF